MSYSLATDSARRKISSRRDTYWAAEPDPEILINSLISKRDEFWQYLEGGSNIIEGVYKLWRFYHGLFYDWEGGRIVMGGEDMDISQLGVNEFRSRLQLLLSYTQKEIDWDPQGTDTSQATLDETKKAAGLLDWAMDEPRYRVAQALRRQKEHALIYRVGYTAAYWDETLGDEIGGDLETLDIDYLGDLCIENPTLWDVIFDPTLPYHKDRQWIMWRTRKNVWDLAETYFSKRDEILALAGTSNEFDRFHGMERGLAVSGFDQDQIDKWYFVHLPTPAFPSGRMTCFSGDVVLKDGPLPKGQSGRPLYRRLPVHPLVHSEMLGSSVIGHSPAVDLAPLQEALNICISTALTNARKFGQTMLYSKSPPNWKALEPGAGVLIGDDPVTVLDFLKSSPELMNLAESILARMDSVSNISAVSRGESTKETSGVHAALLDMKTVQANGLFDQNSLDAASDLGQTILDIFSEKIEEGLEIPIVGQGDITRYSKMSREGLKKVSRVIVKPGNPAMRTPSGRFQIAKQMAELGLITNEKELLSVYNGSPVQRVLDPVENQTKLAHQENEDMKEGRPVVGSITDDHLGHIKIHVSGNVGSVEARFNNQTVLATMPHVLWHMQQLSASGVAQAFMVALRWAPPELVQVLAMLAGPALAQMPQPGSPGAGSPGSGQEGQGGPRQPQGGPQPGQMAESPGGPQETPPGQAQPIAGAKRILGDARDYLKNQTAADTALPSAA